MKKCNKCNSVKDEIDFPWKNKVKGIKDGTCKVCHRKYKRDYYHRNKQAHYDRNKQTELKIKEYINEVKKAGCSICSETCIPCLEFHHFSDKIENVGRLYKWGSLKKVKDEITKCILLCANCHRKVHYGLMQVSAIGSQSVSKTE